MGFRVPHTGHSVVFRSSQDSVALCCLTLCFFKKNVFSKQMSGGGGGGGGGGEKEVPLLLFQRIAYTNSIYE